MNYDVIAERFCKEACKKRIDQFGPWASYINKDVLKQTVEQADNWFELYTFIATYISYDNYMSRFYYRCNPYVRSVF